MQAKKNAWKIVYFYLLLFFWLFSMITNIKSEIVLFDCDKKSHKQFKNKAKWERIRKTGNSLSLSSFKECLLAIFCLFARFPEKSKCF